jgi:hypothetical protein
VAGQADAATIHTGAAVEQFVGRTAVHLGLQKGLETPAVKPERAPERSVDQEDRPPEAVAQVRILPGAHRVTCRFVSEHLNDLGS